MLILLIACLILAFGVGLLASALTTIRPTVAVREGRGKAALADAHRWLDELRVASTVPQEKEPDILQRGRSVAALACGVAVLVVMGASRVNVSQAVFVSGTIAAGVFLGLRFLWDSRQQNLRDRLSMQTPWLLSLISAAVAGSQGNPRGILNSIERQVDSPMSDVIAQTNIMLQYSVTFEDAIKSWRDTCEPLAKVAASLQRIFEASREEQRRLIHGLDEELAHDYMTQAEARIKQGTHECNLVLVTGAAIILFLIVGMPAVSSIIHAMSSSVH
ncbi:MAG: hypothetical protein ACYDAG_00470 [Chloroflexota bacterium]